MDSALLIVQLVVASWMACVGWLVQVIVYPAFRHVRPEAWAVAHARHSSRITVLVFPPMLIQLLVAALFAVAPPEGSGREWAIAMLALVALTWLMTAAVSVRHHRALAGGFDEVLLRGLLAGHAVRTAAWSVALAIAVLQLVRAT